MPWVSIKRFKHILIVQIGARKFIISGLPDPCYQMNDTISCIYREDQRTVYTET